MCDFNPIEEFVNIVEGELSKPDVKYFIEGLSPEVSDEPFGDSIPALRKVGRRYSASVFLALMTMVRYEACLSLLELIVENDLDVEHEELLNAEPTGKDGYPGSWPCDVEFDEAKAGAAGLIWHRIINADLNRAWLEDKLREYEAKGKTFKEVSTALQKVLKYKKLDDVYAAIRFQKYEACFCAVEIVEEAREDEVELKEVLAELKKREITWVRKERKRFVLEPDADVLRNLGHTGDVVFGPNKLFAHWPFAHELVELSTNKTYEVKFARYSRPIKFGRNGKYIYGEERANYKFNIVRQCIETGVVETLIEPAKGMDTIYYLNDTHVAYRNTIGIIHLYSLLTGEQILSEEVDGYAASIAMPEGADFIAFILFGNAKLARPDTLSILNTTMNKELHRQVVKSGMILLGFLDGANGWEAIYCSEKTLYRYNLSAGKVVQELQSETAFTDLTKMSHNGRYVLTVLDKEALLMNTSDLTLLAKFRVNECYSAAFSLDDELLAFGGNKGFIVELAKYLP